MTGRKVSLSAQSLSTGLGQYTESNKLHYWLVCCSVPNVINKASRKLQCSVLKYFPPVCVVSLLCVLSALSKVEVEALPGTDLSISSPLLSSSSPTPPSPLPPPPAETGESPDSAWVVACKISTSDHSSSSLKQLQTGGYWVSPATTGRYKDQLLTNEYFI